MVRPTLWAGLAGLVLGFLLGCLLVCEAKREPSIVELPTTLVVRDTVLIKQPTAVQTRTLVERIPVEVVRVERITERDTTYIRDTVYVPREQKLYESKQYRAWVSGHSPRLDSIEVYKETIYKRQRWALSAGVTLGFDKDGRAVPVAGLTFGYIIK